MASSPARRKIKNKTNNLKGFKEATRCGGICIPRQCRGFAEKPAAPGAPGLAIDIPRCDNPAMMPSRPDRGVHISDSASAAEREKIENSSLASLFPLCFLGFCSCSAGRNARWKL